MNSLGGKSAKDKREDKKRGERLVKQHLAIKHGVFAEERRANKLAIAGCKCDECKRFRVENPGHREWE